MRCGGDKARAISTNAGFRHPAVLAANVDVAAVPTPRRRIALPVGSLLRGGMNLIGIV